MGELIFEFFEFFNVDDVTFLLILSFQFPDGFQRATWRLYVAGAGWCLPERSNERYAQLCPRWNA